MYVGICILLFLHIDIDRAVECLANDEDPCIASQTDVTGISTACRKPRNSYETSRYRIGTSMAPGAMRLKLFGTDWTSAATLGHSPILLEEPSARNRKPTSASLNIPHGTRDLSNLKGFASAPGHVRLWTHNSALHATCKKLKLKYRKSWLFRKPCECFCEASQSRTANASLGIHAYAAFVALALRPHSWRQLKAAHPENFATPPPHPQEGHSLGRKCKSNHRGRRICLHLGCSWLHAQVYHEGKMRLQVVGIRDVYPEMNATPVIASNLH